MSRLKRNVIVLDLCQALANFSGMYGGFFSEKNLRGLVYNSERKYKSEFFNMKIL